MIHTGSRKYFLLSVLAFLIISGLHGCSSTLSNPVGTGIEQEPLKYQQAFSNHWSWGNYNFHLNADHTRVDITPLRQAQHHFNVKTLMENGPCEDCIWITHHIKNADGTINLGVAMRHPYPGNDYYTGFDVKGIVHFPAHALISGENPIFNKGFSLRSEGDPELLNKDGYCLLYGVQDEPPPPYEPLLKIYQPGGRLGGSIDYGYYDWPYELPLNGFKFYYSSENRRYFSTSAVLMKDYHIAIPDGEWDFGYSVDACWAPPLKNPVTNVPDDFPSWANSLANYRLEAEIVGEISGDNPATIVVDVYNHAGPEIPDFVRLLSGDLFDWGQIWYENVEPINMGDFVRWILPVPNQNGAPPGTYRVLVNSEFKKDLWTYPNPDHLEGLEIVSWIHQIVEVKVAS